MTHANRPTTPCRLWDRRRLPLAVARLLPASLAATARANSAPPPVRATIARIRACDNMLFGAAQPFPAFLHRPAASPSAARPSPALPRVSASRRATTPCTAPRQRSTPCVCSVCRACASHVRVLPTCVLSPRPTLGTPSSTIGKLDLSVYFYIIPKPILFRPE
ncbi:atherin-like [Iris pallida]|uniref:Atherin-like n=1 Tax=Iris pallida TaxID=29817 RepID=A0AAX6EIP1_IRIPA|nr:atherin-like [Iris pallida]